MRRITLIFGAMVSLLFFNVNFCKAVQYEIIDLGTLSTVPNSSSFAYSINNSGKIVGWAYNEYNIPRACLFDSSGDNVELGSLLGQPQSGAYSINDAGQIVGGAGASPISPSRACVFDPSGSGYNIDLGSSAAWSINNNGQIVGHDIKNSSARATLFDSTGTGNNTDLGTLGGDWSIAYANNDLGQIVGVSNGSDNQEHACLFDPSGQGDNIDLGFLSTAGTGFTFSTYSIAYSINNDELAVGICHLGRGSTSWPHACLFDLDNGNVDLGTLGGDESEAWSINDNGIIVGRAYTALGDWHACLFDPTGQGNNIDLNATIPIDSGWLLETARSVNNDGWIVGWGINPEGYRHAYLLTPEPSTLFLLGLGAVMMKMKLKSQI